MQMHVHVEMDAEVVVKMETEIEITTKGEKNVHEHGTDTCRWLVGTSFRVVYRKDPVPAFKHKSKLLHGHLVHVHGEIFIDDGAVMAASSQPLGHQIHGDAQDHCLEKYAEVGLKRTVWLCLQPASLGASLLACHVE